MFVAIDGDNIGSKIEYFILKNEIDNLEKFSKIICKTINKLKKYTQDTDHIFISAGDSFLGEIKDINQIIDFVWKLNSKKEKLTFSIGLGESLQLAYLALKYAKASGKGVFILGELQNNTVIFSEYRRENDIVK